MTRRHLAAVLTASATVAAMGLAGCTAGPGPKTGATSDELIAAGQVTHTTALPAVTPRLDDLTALVRKTQPKPRATAGVSAKDVDRALTKLAAVVAATRLDTEHLCAPVGTDTIGRYANSSLRTWMADPANRTTNGEYWDVQATWAGSLDAAPDCAGSHLVGPGVLLGKQQWTPHASRTGWDLAVDSVVRTTHLLADTAGHPEPVSAEWRLTYELAFADGHWSLAGWSNGGYGELRALWDDMALPGGYLPAGAAIGTDPASLAAVGTAVQRWNARPAATTVLRTTTDNAIRRNGTQQDGWISVDTAAPQRGDGSYRTQAIGSGQTDVGFYLDRGEEYYLKTDPKLAVNPVPFTRANMTAPWRSSISEAPALVSSVSVDVLAVSWVKTVQSATAAAPEPCPDPMANPAETPPQAKSAPAVATCHVVLVPTGIAGNMLHAARARGLSYLTVHVGLTADGDLSRIYLDQRSEDLFASHFTGLMWFTSTGDTAPAPIRKPAANQVADSAFIDQ